MELKHKYHWRPLIYSLLFTLAILVAGCTFTIDPNFTREGRTTEMQAEPATGETSSAVIRPSIEAQHEVITETLVYGQADVLVDGKPTPIDLLLDLYQPADAPEGVRPIVLAIHGGAFFRESRANPGIVGIAKGLAARGYVVVSIEYRMALDNPVPSERVQGLRDLVESLDMAQTASMLKIPEEQYDAAPPAAMDDALTALAWIEDHAEMYSLDMSRLVVLGASAGGITTLYTVYNSDDFGLEAPNVAAVVDLWGAFGFSQDASALEAGEPPIFIVHGTADEVVPLFMVDALVKQVKAENVYYEYYPMEGYAHGFAAIDVMKIDVDGQTIFERMVHFLDAQLFPAK